MLSADARDEGYVYDKEVHLPGAFWLACIQIYLKN